MSQENTTQTSYTPEIRKRRHLSVVDLTHSDHDFSGLAGV